MSEVFKFGEIAILRTLPMPYQHLSGMECEIKSHLGDFFIFQPLTGKPGRCLGYAVCVGPVEFVVSPMFLKKKRPPFNGEQIIRDMFINAKQPDLVDA